jgi:hypothetical protein
MNLEAFRALTGISFDSMKARLAAALTRRWEAGRKRNEAIRTDQIRPNEGISLRNRPDLWEGCEVFLDGVIVERNGAPRIDDMLPADLLALTVRAEAAATDAERELAETLATIDRENAAVIAEQAGALAELCGRAAAAAALRKAADAIEAAKR